MTNNEILTVKEAAALLKISEKTCYEWAHMEGFPRVQIGRFIRIPRGLLLDWVNAQAGGCVLEP